MSELPGILLLLAPFFGPIGVGFLCGRFVRQPPNGLAWMQFFIIYVALPCLFFTLISGKPLDELANWRFIGATTLATASAFTVALALGLRAGRDLANAVVHGVAGAYANVGYMGPPLVIAALGPEASAPVLLVLVFDNLFLFSITPLLMAVAGAAGRSVVRTGALIVVRVLTHPFNVAALLGVLFGAFHLKLPAVLQGMLTAQANAAAPSALFLLGVVVGSRPLERPTGDVVALLAIKLVLHPMLAFGMLWAFGISDPIWVSAAVVMAALPPALNIFVISTQYRTGVELASAAVILGTAASVVTLTATLWLIRTGRLPG